MSLAIDSSPLDEPKDHAAHAVRRSAAVRLFSTALWTTKAPPWGPIREVSDAAKFLMRFIGSRDREYFVAIHLSSQAMVIGVEIVSIGDVSSAPVTPREVFKAAILSNAAAIIVGHNHPSGDVMPSPEDVQTYRSLVEAGGLIGVTVVDCLVVSADTWYSVGTSG
ncbi:MAG TPA: JAB domain-containing protein [Gemmatimonadales bacterium]|jgi:DNA repair protein RadC